MTKPGLINKYFLCSIIFFIISVAIGVVVDVASEVFENKKLVEFNSDYDLSEKITKSSKKINALILHAHYAFSSAHVGDNQEHVERYFEDYKKLKLYMDSSVGIKKSYDPEIISIRDRIIAIHKMQMVNKKEYYEEYILLAIQLGNLSRTVEENTKESFLSQEKWFSSVNIGYVGFVVLAYIFLVFSFVIFNKVVFVDPLRALIGSVFDLSEGNIKKEIPFIEKKDEIGMLASAIRTIQKKMNALGVDSLTEVKNRFFMEDNLSRMKDFHIIYIDVDNFKLINDCFGHHFGDAVLCELSRIFCENLGGWDNIYRIGGDEFLIAVNGSREVVDTMIGRVFEQLKDPVIVLGKSVALSVSAGVKYCQTGSNIAQNIYEADKGMYKSKEKPGSYRTYMVEGDQALV